MQLPTMVYQKFIHVVWVATVLCVAAFYSMLSWSENLEFIPKFKRKIISPIFNCCKSKLTESSYSNEGFLKKTISPILYETGYDSFIKRRGIVHRNVTSSVLFSQDAVNLKICMSKSSMWKDIDFTKCEVSKCSLENNFSLMKNSDCDAVVLQSSQLPSNLITRRLNQVWVYLTHEPPLGRQFEHPRWRNFFNMTISYLKDSDIYFPWGKIVQKKDKPKSNYSEIYRMKKKTAVWLASNCRTQSKREKYVKIMEKTLDVDVYGLCGHLKCRNIKRKDDPNDICRDMISKEYKFYLSFENSLCTNYITEKVFLFYQYTRHIIPVVRGVPNAEDFLPKNTYVDASKFASATQLARHLKDLARNEKKYTAMLEEKDKFTVEPVATMFEKAICSLCKNLHTVHGKSTVDLRELKRKSPCKNPTDLS